MPNLAAQGQSVSRKTVAEVPLTGLSFIPEWERKGEPALMVGDPEQAILAPAVGPAASVLVGEESPRVAVGRRVFPHRAPLPLRQGERRLTVVIDQAGWRSHDMPHSHSPTQTSEIA
jgi:hypothetical protein